VIKKDGLVHGQWYGCCAMRNIITGFALIATIAVPLSSLAGDNSTGGEEKVARISAPVKHHGAEAKRQTSMIRAHHQGNAFCRRGDYYCVRAAASPWWPNAPGD